MAVISRKITIISSSATALVIFRGPLIEEMCRRGCSVDALAPDFTDELKAAIKRRGANPIEYRLARTGTSFLGDLLSIADLIKILRGTRPDIVLSHFMKPVIYGTIAATIAKVPRRFAMIEGLGFAFTDTGAESVRKTGLRRVMQGLLRTALRGADRTIFLNDDDRDELVSAGIVAADRSVVLGGIGLPLPEFAFHSVPSKGPPVFLMIGRLVREKGIFEFAEAARSVKTRYPEARFIVLGGLDPKPGSLSEAKLHTWVSEGLIEWPGTVSDVRPYLRESTIYVLPSYREGVPRSTQEAMAIGRAVITTDVPGCRTTVEPGFNGLLVPPRDFKALANAMFQLVEDPCLVAEMGRRSRSLAEERYDIDIVNDRLLRFLDIAS